MRRVNAIVEHLCPYRQRPDPENGSFVRTTAGHFCLDRTCLSSDFEDMSGLFLEKKKSLSDSGISTQFPSRLCICVAMKVDVTKVDTLISQECEDMTRYDTSTALGTYQWTGRLHTHFPILNSA